MSKIVKNVTLSPIFVSDVGVSIPASGSYTIPPQDYLLWAASDNTVTFVGANDLVINDGSFDLGISDGIDLIKGLWPKEIKTLPGGIISYVFNDISAVASGSPSNILTYTAPSDKRLLQVDCSGTNIARYEVKVNGTTIDRQYTNFGSSLSCLFSYSNGIELQSGDVLTVVVLHNRSTVGDFNSKILVTDV